MTLEVTVERADLVRALSRVGHSSGRRLNLVNPLAGTTKISTAGAGDLQLYSTDGISFAGTSAAVEIHGTGSIVVNLPHLERALSVLPAGPIRLRENQRTVTLSSGAAKRFLLPLLGVPYPHEASPTNQNSARLPSAAVLEAISRVEPCRESTDDRPNINGVLLEADGAQLSSCAISGLRAALSKKPIENGEGRWSCYLPERILRGVRELAEAGDVITICSDTAVYAYAEAGMVGCALPGNNFPPYAHFFDQHAEQVCRVAAPELMDAVRTVSAASSDSGLVIQLSSAAQLLVLDTEPSAKDLNEAATAHDAVTLLADYGGIKDPPILVSASNLRESLKAFPGEVDVLLGDLGTFIRLEANGPEFGSLAVIIMPISKQQR